MSDLIEELASFEFDPLGYALWAFPWGEPGPLQNAKLENWQEDFLGELGLTLRSGSVVRMARATGHGIGKSALASIISKWSMDTMPDTKGIITANTETQLKTKTWVEIAKWNRMAISRELFKFKATSIFSADPMHENTWRLDMVPWSERNTEAFAGLHNKGRRLFLMFDESSAIPDLIWEVADGALTDDNTQIIWVAFGNPTKNTGRFREIGPGGKFSKRWNFKSIDSRTVSLTNKKQIEEWKEDYGEDSDFFRVRVKGQYPAVDGYSFIPLESAQNAVKRELPEQNQDDVVLGVDVARYGDDATVIYPRRGRDARSLRPIVIRGASVVEVSQRVRQAVIEYQPSCVFIDGGGVGGGVVDTVRNMRLGCLVYEVDFGAKPDGFTSERYANKRAEIWGEMREWLKTGCIPEHLPGLENTLVEELVAPAYGMTGKETIQLETKRDMRRRGVPSPDAADALACTFALPVPAITNRYFLQDEKPTIAADYNPMELFENGTI